MGTDRRGGFVAATFLLAGTSLASETDFDFQERLSEALAKPSGTKLAALGAECLEAGKTGAAAGCFEEAIRLQPANARARAALGHVKTGSEWKAPAEAEEWDGFEDRFTGLGPVEDLSGAAFRDGALTLGCDYGRLSERFKVPWETVTDFAVYRGKLHLLSCKAPMMHKSGDVLAWDERKGKLEKLYTVNEQGTLHLHVHKDRLFVPGPDEEFNNCDSGFIYVHDGAKWETWPVPGLCHLFDCAFFRGTFFATGQHRRKTSGDGTSRGEVLLAERKDGWKVSYRTEIPKGNSWSRIFYATVFRDRLYANAFTPEPGEIPAELLRYDGKAWAPLDFHPGGGMQLRYCEHRGILYVYGSYIGQESGSMAYRHDGERFERVGGLQERSVLSMSSNGVELVALCGGPEGVSLLRSFGGREWAETAKVEERTAGEILGGWPEPAMIFHEGRLYLGSTSTGKVFAAEPAKEGAFLSIPRRMASRKGWKGILSARVPSGASVRLEIRTAATKEGLAEAPFAEVPGAANGKELSWAAPEGNAWLQYRIALSAADPARSPRVEKLSLR